MRGAFETGKYKNVFVQYGYQEEKVSERLEKIFQTLFYGTKEERIYHPVALDMGYVEDTGNHDVRTEGMSYAMMMCVQMNRQEEFDRLWKWTRAYMYMEEGENAGYFAWSCQVDGTKNAYGPAPDGEEFFAMALFFASHRFGDREGIFCYSKEARDILSTCLHKGEKDGIGKPMWNLENYLIKFITECDFTDPSYHLPHFYELFSLWADEEDQAFWAEAAKASRSYLKKACHHITGLCAEYADYDGVPRNWSFSVDRHDWYYSDAYRTIANIGLDYAWFEKEEWACETADKLQRFYSEEGDINGVYLVDGTKVENMLALHPVAVIATNAQASLAAKGAYAKEWVDRFYQTPLREGNRRYYDNCLYFFAFLSLSGNYRVW